MYYYARTHLYYANLSKDIVYVRKCVHILCPACPGRMNIFSLSMASFLKRLKQFRSRLLPYTATIVWTTMMPSFSFWDQSYLFVPNSKLQSATKDRKHKQVELLRRTYSRQRLFSLDMVNLVAIVQPVLGLTV